MQNTTQLRLQLATLQTQNDALVQMIHEQKQIVEDDWRRYNPQEPYDPGMVFKMRDSSGNPMMAPLVVAHANVTMAIINVETMLGGM